ncbi:MAG: DUF368 domain-containing protein [Gammaproteobacteria bacterium]|nr:DUF368 domain-containing protein [Gammaproteobacteria bacterium]
MSLADLKSDLKIGLRGVLMGIAEVVPGVSGGTIAFITGIYHTLIEALSRFGVASFGYLKTPKVFVEYHHLRFLAALGIGMIFGIALFANLMRYLLIHHQPLVWAFFFGVIAMSVWVIGRQRRGINIATWGSVGLLLSILLLSLPAREGGVTLVHLYFGGAIAVCAWILPAISGSYVLLVLGMYETVIAAVADLEWSVLMVVAAGCASGLLVFSKVLAWLFSVYEDYLLSLLSGFMLGSLVRLWPWQAAQGSLWERVMLPATFQQKVGADSQLLLVILIVGLGAGLLWLLSRIPRT